MTHDIEAGPEIKRAGLAIVLRQTYYAGAMRKIAGEDSFCRSIRSQSGKTTDWMQFLNSLPEGNGDLQKS